MRREALAAYPTSIDQDLELLRDSDAAPTGSAARAAIIVSFAPLHALLTAHMLWLLYQSQCTCSRVVRVYEGASERVVLLNTHGRVSCLHNAEVQSASRRMILPAHSAFGSAVDTVAVKRLYMGDTSVQSRAVRVPLPVTAI